MTKNNFHPLAEILILETERSSDNSLNIALPSLPFSFKKTGSTEEMLYALKTGDYPLVMLNVEANFVNISGTINKIKKNSPDIQIIVLTDAPNRSIADQAAHAGADCLLGPVTINLLISKIKNACEIVRTKNELMLLRQQVAMNYAFDNLVGVSAEIQKVKRIIQHSIKDRTTVILSGEEGTGKNLIARIIHYHSSGRNNPFIVIDFSTFAPERLESELNQSNSPNCTVFMDHLHLADKTALLNMQKQIAKRSAGNGLGFRLIMTVNEPLYNMYSQGIIDRKLIESLNAIEISLPALRDRTEDIELLASYFLRMISYDNNAPTRSITPGALEILKNYSWPGNVRELENCLRRASAICHNNCIDVSELRLVTAGSAMFRTNSAVGNPSKSTSLEENQRHLITDALDANEWNFSQTAIQLGIGRTTLWRKVRKFNLIRGAETRSETELAVNKSYSPVKTS